MFLLSNLRKYGLCWAFFSSLSRIGSPLCWFPGISNQIINFVCKWEWWTRGTMERSKEMKDHRFTQIQNITIKNSSFTRYSHKLICSKGIEFSQLMSHQSPGLPWIDHNWWVKEPDGWSSMYGLNVALVQAAVLSRSQPKFPVSKGSQKTLGNGHQVCTFPALYMGRGDRRCLSLNFCHDFHHWLSPDNPLSWRTAEISTVTLTSLWNHAFCWPVSTSSGPKT